MSSAAEISGPMIDPGAWLSFHAYYHGDRDRLIRAVVPALLEELRASASIDHYFFIRYRLGGPHIRLRLLPSAGLRSDVERAARRHFETFLGDQPSEESVDSEEIRREDARILGADGGEAPADTPANNSLSAGAFSPETERYGGSEFLPASLVLFQASSTASLLFLDAVATMGEGKRLTAAARVLIRQAASLAADSAEFEFLVGYGPRWWPDWNALFAKADAAYGRSGGTFRTLIARAAGQPTEEPLLLHLERAACAFRDVIREAPSRLGISESHLHMTANRLGLTNIEEVYLSRLLSRAASDCRGDRDWGAVDARFNRPPSDAVSAYGALREEASRGFLALACRAGGGA
ncbi:MAG: thiopeptide-type bacteriocin biosynthesis protein [Acidobacteriota bacterium]